jgi:hypothetical protein
MIFPFGFTQLIFFQWSPVKTISIKNAFAGNRNVLQVFGNYRRLAPGSIYSFKGG